MKLILVNVIYSAVFTNLHCYKKASTEIDRRPSAETVNANTATRTATVVFSNIEKVGRGLQERFPPGQQNPTYEMTNFEAATLTDRAQFQIQMHLSGPAREYERDAPLAGPDFPAPSHLGSSATLQAAIKKFEVYLNDKSSELKTEDTAFAVALFSSRENATLYENYYTPPADVGVKEVDRDSVFRIGSISKVITVWAFLIAAGDEYFSDPVTKHIPELAELVSKSSETDEDPSVVYDDIDNVRWEDITLGQLASHGAGIARDRELLLKFPWRPKFRRSS